MDLIVDLELLCIRGLFMCLSWNIWEVSGKKKWTTSLFLATTIVKNKPVRQAAPFTRAPHKCARMANRFINRMFIKLPYAIGAS